VTCQQLRFYEIISFMPTARAVPVRPSEYWNSSQTRKAQRLYISFCELAAAALDYAEGLSLLRRDARRQGAARLNWAGTAFYYSLVHSARFLIFTAVGDFPTQHNKLAQAFSESHSGTVSTDWLKSFATSATVQYTTTISLEQLVDYWSSDTSKGDTAALFEWFANALTKAKALRNENNYESLLIAHEYQHSYLNSAFKQLANAMEGVARTALAAVVRSYARVLEPQRSSASVDARRESQEHGAMVPLDIESQSNDDGQRRSNEAAFVRRYVENRIIEPVRSWYGTDMFVVSKAITGLMEPLSALPIGSEIVLSTFEEAVSVDLFGPKVGLMDKFMRKITELQEALDETPAEHASMVAEAVVQEGL